MFILEIILYIQSFLIDINSLKNHNNFFDCQKNHFPISKINEVNRQWNHIFYYLISKRNEYKDLNLNVNDHSIKNKMYQRTMELVNNDYKNLKNCYMQNEEICNFALDKNPLSMKYIKNHCLKLFNRQAYMYKLEKGKEFPNYKKIIQMKKTLKHVNFNKISETEYKEICFLFVQIDGEFLQYMRKGKLGKDDYYQLCINAVSNNGFAICFIKNKTKYLCSLAESNNYMARRYFKRHDIFSRR